MKTGLNNKKEMQPVPLQSDEALNPGGSTSVRKKILDFSYSLDDLIGEGYSSRVFKGINESNGSPVAIKVIDMNKMTDNVLREMLAQEIESLQQLKTVQNILHLEEAISTVNNTYIITELCPDGDLSDVIATGCLEEAEAAMVMQQVIKGYLQICKKGVVHRDLKPSNVFLQGYNCKIADFGFSAKASRLKEPCNYNVGSPLYMAPEALLKNFYSYKSDIWSLGIIYYELLFGRTPWAAKTQKELAHTIKKNSILTLIPSRITRTSLSFLLSTLNPDLRDRMTPQQLEGFELTLDPVVRYVQYKKTLEADWVRHMENYQIVRSILPPRYNPRPLDSAYNVPEAYSNEQRLESQTEAQTHQTQVHYQRPQQPPHNFNRPEASASPVHEKRQANAIVGRPNNQEEEITRALSSQIHFCRFLSKVVVRMVDRQSELRRALLGIIFYKLGLIVSCENSNPYGIPTIQAYRQTTDFPKLINIARKYQAKYGGSLGRPPGSSSITYEQIMDMLKIQIRKGYTSLRNGDRRINVELLDYLTTVYQLLGLMLRTTLRQFCYQSNIRAIADQVGQATSTGDVYIMEIEQKIQLLGLA